MNNHNVPQISRVAEFSDGDTIQIFGENFDKQSKVYLWYPEGDAADTVPSAVSTIRELPTENILEFEFDSVFTQVGYVAPTNKIKERVAVIWLQNENGLSKPFVVNNPRIFNQSHIRATFGDDISFSGSSFGVHYDKMLLLVNTETSEKKYIKNLTDTNVSVWNLSGKEHFIADFIIPKDLPIGKYKAYLHNGTGGEYGWSDEAELEIYAENTLVEYFANKWNDLPYIHRDKPECEIIKVRADEDGSAVDMYEPLQNAIDSLENGGIVKLTAGIYGISKTLTLKPGVVLKGVGRNNTIIRSFDGCIMTEDMSDVVYASRHGGLNGWSVDWRKHIEKEHNAAVIRLTEKCGIEDIGIEMGNGANIGIFLANINSFKSESCFINNVAVEGMYKQALNMGNPHGCIYTGFLSVVSNSDLTIYNSTFRAMAPITFLPARNERLRIINNVFDCSPAQIHESTFRGVYNSIVIGNTFSNGRRSFMCQGGFSNNLVHQNRSVGVSRSHNAEEQYMSEFGYSIWHGSLDEVGKDYAAINNIDSYSGKESFTERLEEFNQYLCVVDGCGFGQYRRIIGCEGDKLLLDKPWDVLPNKDTLITLVSATCNNIWINNNTDTTNGPTQFIWGSGIDNIAYGHEATLAYAITAHCFGLNNDHENTKMPYGMHVVAFNRYMNNQVKASGMGIRTDTSYYPPIRDDDGTDPIIKRYKRTYGLIGNVFKRNALEGQKGACYLKNQSVWLEESYNCGMELGGAYNLVEKNLVAGYANAIKFRYDCEGNYMAKNKFLYNDNRFIFEIRGNDYTRDDSRISGPDAEKLWFN